MTTHTLFHALSALTNDLQAEADRLRFSPAKLALAALVARLDAVLDTIVDEGIVEKEDDPPCP